ncbi:MAG: TolC family protein [Endomicrobium sp.]|nr:TolC family protein [Endomicrobium sp.]
MKILKLSLVIMFIFVAFSAFCEVLSVKDYIDIVVKNNKEFRSVNLKIDSTKEKLLQTERKYSYLFKACTNYIDGKNRAECKFNEMETYSANISKFLKMGMDVSFGLKCDKSYWKSLDMNNSSVGTDLPKPKSIFLTPSLSLQQSLWKDVNGVFTKAVISKEQAVIRSGLYLLEYEIENILLRAKFAYWDLAYSKTVIDFKKLSLERARKILNWTQKKYDMDLSEKSNLLQAQAAVKSKELDLNRAYETEKRAIKEFNQFLNIEDGSVIKYELEKFEKKSVSFKDKTIPEKKRVRADVLSALENVHIALCDQIIFQKSLGAELALKGSFDCNVTNGGIYEKKQIGRLNYSIGLEYTLPLDFRLRRSINKSYKLAKLSTQESAEYAVIKESNEWLQILDDWNSAKNRLKLAGEIERIQIQRHKEDENLLRKGRSTTYFVLKSEQELDDAALNVLQSILDLIKIYEKAKILYSGNYKYEF